MKKILEHGLNLRKVTRCDACGCKFSFIRGDCYWNRPLTSYIIECPECGKEIILGENFFEQL